MIDNKKKNLLFLSVLIITLLLGISLVSATNSTNTTKTSNDTTETSTTHNVISTNQVNNTVKEETQIVKTNKTVKNQNNEEDTTKTLKKDVDICTWEELVNNVNYNGTYTLNNDIIANTTLNTKSGINTTINGNGFTITFMKNGQVNITSNSILNITNTILDGNNTGRVDNGIINNGTLILTNNTVKNFNAIDYGVIYNTGVNTIITNNTFKNNYGDMCAVGVIYNTGVNTIITNNTFKNNYVTSYVSMDGTGVIYNTGTNITIKNNNFTNNTAQYGLIGAIYSTGSDMTIINNIFNNNQAYYYGAVYTRGANTTIRNNTFIGNTASEGNVGALSNSGSNTTITNNTFKNNYAISVGALSNSGSNTTITNNIFSYNHAEYGACAISNGGSNTIITNNTFKGNTGGWDSVGALNNSGANATIKDNTFNNNVAEQNSGALYNTGINTIIINNTFNNNKVTYTGVGAIYNTGANTTIINNSFTNNSADENAGALYNTGANTTIINNAFKNNQAGNGAGAIYNTAMNNNSAVNVTIMNNTFINNLSNGYYRDDYDEYNYYGGGAIYNDRTNIRITNNIFNNNTARTYNAGAIGNTGANTTITNNTFNNNTSKQSGGAIYNQGRNIIITNNNFTNNSANDGGAISNCGSNCNFNNNTFTNNIALSGETLYITGTSNVIANNTYFNNTMLFANKTIISTVDEDHVLITANITLENPEYYDSNILNKTDVTLHLMGINNNLTITQKNGNTTFTDEKIPTDTYTVYETLTIDQSTKDNYKTNNITITVNNPLTISDWNDLKQKVKTPGTYTIGNDMIANSLLTENNTINVTIYGNGHTITFTKDGQIDLNKNSILTIENIILNGNNTNRTNSGITNNGKLTVQNSTLKNFHNTDEYGCGGAIYNENGENCLFTNNIFTGNNATFGGAIYNYEGVNCSFISNNFIGNNANDGGAIENWGINNCSYTNNNFIFNNALNYGGATYNNCTKCNFTSNIFIGNNANGFGGGAIYNYGENCNFTNNNFTNNTAGETGGAIINSCKNSTFIDNTFTNNTARELLAGAIYNYGEKCNFTNNIFIENNAQDGGAILNNGANCTFTSNKFTQNNATSYGGAIQNNGANCTFTGNNFTSNNATKHGGAISNDGANCTFTGNNFTSNNATQGGAIYIEHNGRLNGNNCSFIGNNFINNTANINGSAIKIESSNDVTITDNLFNSNLVASGNANGETLIISGYRNIVANNTYFNNSIVFANKTITSIVDGGNVLIIANITLASPSSYDSDILNKTNYTIYKDSVLNKTQESNSTFNLTSYEPLSKVYETLSIAQSTYDNYKTNITIIKIVTGSTIYVSITYPEILTVNGTVINITSGSQLYVTVGNNIKTVNVSDEGTWTVDFEDLSAGNYNVTVSYLGNDTHYEFRNSTNVTIKQYVNSTISASNIVYGNTETIKGIVDNTQVKSLNVTVNGKINKVNVNTDGSWSTTFSGLASGSYTAVVSYISTTDNYSNFKNSTTFNVTKKTTSSSISASNIVYGSSVTVKGIVDNSQVKSLNVTVNNKTNTVQVSNNRSWTTSFSGLSAGSYTAVVSYTSTTGNYSNFKNSTTFNVTKKTTSSSISASNIVYGSSVTVKGIVDNSQVKSLNVTVNNKTNHVIVNNNGSWITSFSGLSAGSYTVTVSYTSISGNYSNFKNSTTFNVTKKGANSTISTNNIVYGSNVTIMGIVDNIQVKSLNVSVNGKTNTVTVGNNRSWSTSFSGLPVGSYTAVVSYSSATGNYSNFKNSSSFNVAKKTTNTTISTNNIVYGNTETVKGMVDNTQVKFLNVSVNGIINTVTVGNNRSWSTSFSGLPVGSYTAVVSYSSATGNYSNFTNSSSFNVAKKTANTTISTSNIVYGNTETVKGMVDNTQVKFLNVTVNGKINTVTVGNNRSWSTSFSGLSVGSYTAVVSYSSATGNYSNFKNSTTFNVAKKTTNTTISTSNIVYGNNVTIKGIVDNTQVKFLNVTVGTTRKTVTVKNRAWSVNFNNMAVGKYNVVVSYAGDSNHKAFKNTTTVSVSKAKSVITSQNVTAKLGSTVELKANATLLNGTGISSGKIIVKINGKTNGTTNINKGKISYKLSLSTDKFEGNKYNVTFVYGGSSTFLSSQANIVLTITKFQSKFNVKVANVTYIEDTGVITVNITNGSGYVAKNGSIGLKIDGVTYKENGKAVTAQVSKGVAVIKFNATEDMFGNNNILITYSGNNQFNSATTTIKNAFIVQNKIRTVCTVNKTTSTLGQNVTLTAKLTTKKGVLIKSGKATVKINGVTLGYATISNGVAKYTLYLDPTVYDGYNYKITFTYKGSTTYSSVTANGILTVNKYTPKFTYTKVTTKVGKTVKISVKITNKDKTFNSTSGIIGLKINGQVYKVNKTAYTVNVVNGVATFNIPITNKMIGNNTITFTYTGNNKFNTGKTTITNGLIVKA